MSDNMDASTENNMHYVYKQTSQVVLNNEELTEEFKNMKLRLSLLEELVYGTKSN